MIILRIEMDTGRTPNKSIDKKTALAKAESFCAYQERSQQEVRDKLYSYGLKTTEVEELISELIGANFLNEERFAIAYALGKFRIKKWGRLKIVAGLKNKRVPPGIINKALRQIDAGLYFDTLQTLLKKKNAAVKESNHLKKKQKLLQYAAAKGFEKDLIFDILNSSDLL
ncbi:regulatory protein RecX [Arcticibacter tournemirensis]